MSNPRTTFFFFLALLIFPSTPTTCQELGRLEKGSRPSNRGDLHEDLTLCEHGKRQSPIDVNQRNVHPNQSMGSLVTGYYRSEATMKNSGYEIKVIWPIGGGSLLIGGKNYVLRQLHWHSPSEHTLNQKRYPLEMHMVHQISDNEIAVVGIFYEIGQPDPFITPELMHYLIQLADPQQDEVHVGLVQPPVIEKDPCYYRYSGSLTTPPCNEGVIWTLLQEVRTVSPVQLHLLRAALHGINNSRPIQPFNGRTVSLYKPRFEEHASS